jgi:D-alanyl-D-alanine endopeptidase (penicillin-binding protein 7)
MVNRKTLPRVLLVMAGLVFVSANTMYVLEGTDTQAAGSSLLHFDFEHVRDTGPYCNLKSAIVVNYDNGEVLYTKNANDIRPIASITKLVTAMVVLDHGVDLSKTELITRKDAYRSSRSRLRVGYEMTVEDLLYAALLNSDNRAARALARATSGSQEAFVKEMNFKAKQLGLKHTSFVEPTGLSQNNVSTAVEVAKLLHYAYQYDLIASITGGHRHQCRVVNRKRTTLPMANTNLLIHSRYDVLSGKTGYIRAADYCLATLVENSAGERLTVVVLGVPGDRLRFREARRLADWGFKEIDNFVEMASS